MKEIHESRNTAGGVMTETLDRMFGQGKYDLIRTMRSAYGLIAFIVYGGSQLVVKKVKTISNGNQPSAQSAQLANQLTEYFYKQLNRVGVPVPERYSTTIHGTEAVHVISYEGVDFAEQIDADHTQTMGRVRLILEAIQPVLRQQEWVVGLDPRLSNFAGTGRAVYFDLFPPLCIYGDNLFVHYPNLVDSAKLEMERVRKFSALGVLNRLRFGILAVQPSVIVNYERMALEVLPQPLRHEVGDYFAGLPDNQIGLVSEQRLAEIIEAFQGSEIEAMRSFAAKLITEQGEERNRLMREVFVLTSVYSSPGYPPSQEARLTLFKDMLKSRIRGEK